jgi:integrase
MSDFNSICITRQTKYKYYLSIVWNGRRVRIFNGKKIGSNSTPNTLPQNLRLKAFKALEVEFLKAIENGWTPSDDWSVKQTEEAVRPGCILKSALASKIKQGISDSYSRKLIWIINKLNDKLDGREPNPKRLAEFINDNNWTPATRTIIRRHLIAFEKELEKYGYEGSIKSNTTKFKTEETLHKPFKDVKVILDDILVFNQKLHLCCLLAYGCLLRPHREIRLLTWGDFAEDLTYVSLSGKMNKGKRNRIVPVSPYIRSYLKAFRDHGNEPGINVFTGSAIPFNQSYFLTLWGRYKKASTLLEQNQTLYSFRHSGAIHVYENTGSLVKLQQVMGHSSLQASMTYLRGLEVRQLSLNDMPALL